MPATKLKAKIEQLQLKQSILVQEKQSLEEQIKELERKNKAELEQKDLEWKNKSEELKIENDTQTSSLNGEISSLTAENKAKQLQLDKREVKKLAEAYGEQEAINKKEETFWLKGVLAVGIALFISAMISIKITHNVTWHESVKYYVIDIILSSAVWFCVSQYSNAIKLKNDYANRKVLAQSFNNILNNMSEDQEIKNKFIEKTTDVLCAPPVVGDKEPLLSKKVLKDLVEIVSVAKRA